jgi:hypothetical protein
MKKQKTKTSTEVLKKKKSTQSVVPNEALYLLRRDANGALQLVRLQDQ